MQSYSVQQLQENLLNLVIECQPFRPATAMAINRSVVGGEVDERMGLVSGLNTIFVPLDSNVQVQVYRDLFAGCTSDESCESLTTIASFASIAVFASVHLPEYTRLPFGGYHKAFGGTVPRGERGQKVNILAPRGLSESVLNTCATNLA